MPRIRHVHDLFDQEGATQVIWVWSPNVINPVPTVRLKPYWPGEEYVDWVGVIGYYARTGPSTFSTLYGPTTTQIRAFTKKPAIIAETAAEAGQRTGRHHRPFQGDGRTRRRDRLRLVQLRQGSGLAHHQRSGHDAHLPRAGRRLPLRIRCDQAMSSRQPQPPQEHQQQYQEYQQESYGQDSYAWPPQQQTYPPYYETYDPYAEPFRPLRAPENPVRTTGTGARTRNRT